MNTKMIMTLSALLLGVIGITLTFFPHEIITHVLITPTATFPLLIIQILGALYFAFAMLNWMAKGSVIGGIYNRPIAIANASHFLIGGLALIKMTFNQSAFPLVFWVLTAFYSIFAVLFGLILFQNPASIKKAG